MADTRSTQERDAARTRAQNHFAKAEQRDVPIWLEGLGTVANKGGYRDAAVARIGQQVHRCFPNRR